MRNLIKKWFSRSKEDDFMQLPENEHGEFVLKIEDIEIAYLSFEKGEWTFQYSKDFIKNHSDVYNTIIGFPRLDKVYKSKSLWPFFLIRIPGLKQPAIQKIIKEENIDTTNELELLKRFGKKTISNPYELSF
jgi:HipA-like protein